MQNSFPVKASAGQLSTQILQFPQFFPIGLPVGVSGAFVNIVPHLALGPKSLFINKQLLPIQPNPDMYATAL